MQWPFPDSAHPVGIGLRSAHYQEIIELKPSSIGWLEIHPENYFGGGAARHYLSQLRQLYPVSFHCVGLSLGSAEPVSQNHLEKIKELIELYDPLCISDHAAWSASGNAHLNDLLPLPYTPESLDWLCRNVDRTQDIFGRVILIENPSTYLMYKDNVMSEPDFMNAIARKTGCGILLDVNNIYVQSHNHGLDPYAYIDAIDMGHVGEIHLAGHTRRQAGNETLLIDTHNRRICADVWDLYRYTLERSGEIMTLIEWDQDYPPLHTLLDEAEKAYAILRQTCSREEIRCDNAA